MCQNGCRAEVSGCCYNDSANDTFSRSGDRTKAVHLKCYSEQSEGGISEPLWGWNPSCCLSAGL
jgi:hypothetical protein